LRSARGGGLKTEEAKYDFRKCWEGKKKKPTRIWTNSRALKQGRHGGHSHERVLWGQKTNQGPQRGRKLLHPTKCTASGIRKKRAFSLFSSPRTEGGLKKQRRDCTQRAGRGPRSNFRIDYQEKKVLRIDRSGSLGGESGLHSG